MKKTITLFLTLTALLLLTACGDTMSIKGVKIAEEDASCATVYENMIGSDYEQYAYEIATDGSVDYMEVRLYALQDGQWEEWAVLGKRDLTAGKKRLSMAFGKLPYGLVVFGDSYKPEWPEGFELIEGASVIEQEPVTIVPGEEIPLAINCFGPGTGEGTVSVSLEQFDDPEALETYDHVCALTIYFREANT